MAQTADGMSFFDAEVIISDDAWVTHTELKGHGASVAVSGGERATGEEHTFDGDTPIVKPGKRASIDVTVRYVYTDAALDPFEALMAMYEAAGGQIYLQYSPDDSQWYKSGDAILTGFGYPAGEAGDGAVVMCEFVVKCAALTTAAVSG